MLKLIVFAIKLKISVKKIKAGIAQESNSHRFVLLDKKKSCASFL